MAKKYGKDDLIGAGLLGGAIVYVFKGATVESVFLAVPVFAVIAGIWWAVIMLAEPVANWLRYRPYIAIIIVLTAFLSGLFLG